MSRSREDWHALEESLGYTFRNPDLLHLAFVHRSFLNECTQKNIESNERLEFLGDAVLQLVVSDLLFSRYPNHPEGQLSKRRSQIVCEKSFATLAKNHNLGRYLRLGHGEENSGGRERMSILADCFEAVCGAIYLDGGLEWHRKYFSHVIEEFHAGDSEEVAIFIDYKSKLQELLQRSHKDFDYRLLEEYGPDHEKQFVIGLYVDNRLICKATGRNKKKTQQEVARIAYHRYVEG